MTNQEKVEEFIINVITELNMAFIKLQKENDKYMHTLALLSFAQIEVFANYRSLYNSNNNEGNKIKIKNWIDKFILTENNSCFNEYVHYKSLTSDNIYEIRCSTVHFFSPVSDHIFFTADEQAIEVDIITSMKEKGFIGISNNTLQQFILKGVNLMNEIIFDKHNSSTEHEDGIYRIYEKIEKEGGNKITIKNTLI